VSNKPDIVTVLRAAAVIPDDLRSEDFRRLLFDAAETIEALRQTVIKREASKARQDETVEELRSVVAAYRAAAESEAS